MPTEAENEPPAIGAKGVVSESVHAEDTKEDLLELRWLASQAHRPRVRNALQQLIDSFQSDSVEDVVQVLECAVVVHRLPGTHLGVSFEPLPQDGAMRIAAIHEDGLLNMWNRMNPDTVIEPGDFIVEVNEVRGSTAALEEACRMEGELIIKLERWLQTKRPLPASTSPQGAHGGGEVRRAPAKVRQIANGRTKAVADYIVDVDKTNGQSLGMTIKSTDVGTLLITEVTEGGLVAAWNARHPPDMKVKAGDHIVSVNSIEGDVVRLKAECSRWGRQTIGVKRGEKAARWPPVNGRAAEGRVGDRPTEWSQFVVTVEKATPDEKLGLATTAFNTGSLLITEVGDGLIKDWNSKCDSQELLVRKGDHIIGVNEVNGNTDLMQEEFKKIGPLQLVLQRARPRTEGSANVLSAGEFLVVVDRREGDLGISIKVLEEGALLVTKVSENGLLAAWNEKCPDRQVIPGNRIVQVNAARGNAALLKQECQKKGELRLRVQ